ncbi:MAG: hypothetical protein ABL897_12875 [Hyphomicrobium sp.]
MSAPDQQRFTARGLKVAAFIALAGPLVGTLVFSAVPAVRLTLSATSAAFSLSTLADIGGALLFVLVFGYAFGGLSAVLSAAVLGVLTARSGTFGYGIAALVGAGSGIVGGLVLGVLTQTQEGFTPGLAVFLLPFALLSSLICRWLLERFGLLPKTPETSLAQH